MSFLWYLMCGVGLLFHCMSPVSVPWVTDTDTVESDSIGFNLPLLPHSNYWFNLFNLLCSFMNYVIILSSFKFDILDHQRLQIVCSVSCRADWQIEGKWWNWMQLFVRLGLHNRMWDDDFQWGCFTWCYLSLDGSNRVTNNEYYAKGK